MRQVLVLGSTCTVSICVAIFAGMNVSASDDPPAPGTQEFYAERVTPILATNCLKCHDDTALGGLQMLSYALIRKGGKDGPVIVPGDPDASLLIQAVRRRGDLKMPPKVALNESDVAVLEAWVKAGAVGRDPAAHPAAESANANAPTNSPQTPTAAPGTSATIKPVAVEVDADFFENKVRPILANNCYECHTDSASGGLRLDSKAAFDHGGGRGQLIVPGDPDKSLLIQAVRQTGPLKMPKGGRLRADEVAILESWVQHGAPWPTTASTAITSITARTGAITEK